MTRSFDVYFDLRPNKRLSKHSWGWWFETLSSPLWRHRNATEKEYCHERHASETCFCCWHTIVLLIVTSPVWKIPVALLHHHYNDDIIMSAMASQITSLTIVYSIVYSGADQRKHQSSASLAFVRGIHRWLVNSPHKGPVTLKLFLFNDVVMQSFIGHYGSNMPLNVRWSSCEIRAWITKNIYRKIFNIKRTKSQSLNVSRLGLQLSVWYIEDKSKMENEDVVGAAPTGAAPTTSEWSAI